MCAILHLFQLYNDTEFPHFAQIKVCYVPCSFTDMRCICGFKIASQFRADHKAVFSMQISKLLKVVPMPMALISKEVHFWMMAVKQSQKVLKSAVNCAPAEKVCQLLLSRVSPHDSIIWVDMLSLIDMCLGCKAWTRTRFWSQGSEEGECWLRGKVGFNMTRYSTTSGMKPGGGVCSTLQLIYQNTWYESASLAY